MKRKIIKINEELCNGCGNCIPNCAEGALQMIDGKARLISDLFCDGLGACLGYCPTGAIKIEEREAEPYDEKRVMKENIIPAGINTIKAHLKHLLDHNEEEYYNQAISYLKENNIEIPKLNQEKIISPKSSCPGSQEIKFNLEKSENKISGQSMLSQWPIQLHLINPKASYYQKTDLLIAADCTAFSYGAFHNDFLAGKSIAIACPKLDHNQDVYTNKIISLVDDAKINTITAVIMEVPCCSGLLFLIEKALKKTFRKVPVKKIIISLDGKILTDEWINL